MTLVNKKAVDPKVEALKTAGLTDTEIADFQEFLANKERKEKVKQAKEIANGLVGEGGKYGKAYGELNDQLDAIWQKALAEGRKQVGLTEDE